jgi:hypothetical protein
MVEIGKHRKEKSQKRAKGGKGRATGPAPEYQVLGKEIVDRLREKEQLVPYRTNEDGVDVTHTWRNYVDSRIALSFW